MEDNIFEKLRQELAGVRENVPLKEHTTFKIGGPARYFLEVQKKEDLVRALEAAKKFNIPFFILGGGSNLLVSDDGFAGLVIKMENREISLEDDTIIHAGAGIVLGHVVDFSIKHSLEGLEWAGGLPGTFGGAIRGNAGAFGGEIKDSILEVTALGPDFTVKVLSNAECQFSYRSSFFKKEPWIILSAKLALKKGDKENLDTIAKSRIHYRNEKHPLEYPSAGSMFKNVPFDELSEEVQKLFLDKLKKDPFPIIPAAWFVIGAGLTGARIGGAQISQKHSNYLVNVDHAKAQDVLDLIDLAKKAVKEKYGVILEPEVQYLG